jgi:hypothetical protein
MWGREPAVDSGTGDDLIVCRVDTRACEVVNSGPASLVLPEVGGCVAQPF